MSFQTEGQGPAVVLLHSSMSSRNQWRALVEQLRPDHRVITIDLLGYGESPMRRRDNDYRLADEARHVEGILARTLQPHEPFHLVGHSYGAVVALGVAQRAPRRIASLALYEPVAFHMLPPWDPARQEFQRLGEELCRLEAAGEAVAGTSRFIDFWSGLDTFSGLPEVKQQAFTTLLPKVLMEFRAIDGERRVTAWLREFNAPVCLMHGSSSPYPARRITNMLADLLPCSRRIEFGAGHMGPVTHPDMVNPEIARFVANADSRATGRPKAESPKAAAELMPRVAAAGSWPKACAVALAALLCIGPVSRSTATTSSTAAHAWRDLPAELTHGGRFALVAGNPRVAGRFVVRVDLAPGFELAPRRAKRDLQLIVLSGDLTIGRGTIMHPAGMRDLTSGYFARFEAGQTWFARTEHGASLQIFGTGPIEG